MPLIRLLRFAFIQALKNSNKIWKLRNQIPKTLTKETILLYLSLDYLFLENPN